MSKVRLNLSRYKGMNLSTFAHSSNELIKCINLKPTENGLEMRNSAREVLRISDFNSLFIQKLIVQNILDLYYYDMFISLYDNDDVVIDLYNGFYDSLITYLYNNLSIFNFFEDKNFGLVNNGEYIYFDDVARRFYATGLFPLSFTSSEIKEFYKTPYKGIYIGAGFDNKLYLRSFFNDLYILFNNSSVSDTDVGFSLVNYSIALKNIYGCALAQRNSYTVYDNLNKHITVNPKYIDFSYGQLSLFEMVENNSSTRYTLTFSKGFYKNDKSVQETGLPLITCKGDGEFQGTNNTLFKIDLTKSYQFESDIVKIRKVNSFIIVLLANGNLNVLEETETGFNVVLDNINFSNAQDVDILYLDNINKICSLFVKTTTKQFLIMFNFNSMTYNISDVSYTFIKNNIDVSSYNKVVINSLIHTASIKFENLIIFYGGSNPILGVVVDCDVRYDNLNTNITNVENYILIEQSILRQYGDGNIVDIEFGDKFNYEINNENIPVSCRPYFGISENQTTIISNDDTHYLFVNPVLPNSFMSFADNYSVLTTTSYYNNSYVRWNYWLMYVNAPSLLDTGVDNLRLVEKIGDKYFSYSYKNTDGSFIEKRFDTIFSSDNVVLYNFGLPEENIKYNTETALKDFAFKAFIGNVSGGTFYFFGNYVGEGNIQSSGAITTNTAIKFIVQDKVNAGDVCGLESKTPIFLKKGSYYLSFRFCADSDKNCRVVLRNSKSVLLDNTFNNTFASWDIKNYSFSVSEDGEYFLYFFFSYGATGQATYGLSDISLNYASLFQIEVVKENYNPIKVNDVTFYSNILVVSDMQNNAVYLTSGGLCFIDVGNYILLEKPMFVRANNFGIYIATDRKLFYLQGYDINTFQAKVLLNEGATIFDKFSFVSVGSFLVFYNNSSVFFIQGDKVADIGAMISTILMKDRVRYAAIDVAGNRICLPVDIEMIGNTGIEFDNENYNIYCSFGYAFFDLNKSSWYIYTYNDRRIDGGFVYYSNLLNQFVIDMGSDGSNNILGVCEVSDEEMRDNKFKGFEDWDKIFIEIVTREMSLTQDVASYKRINSIVVDNYSKRGEKDTNVDYSKVRERQGIDFVEATIYEKFNSFDDTQSIRDRIKIFNPHSNSFALKFRNAKINTGAIGIKMARVKDNENPKIILKDLVIDFDVTSYSVKESYDKRML